MGSIEQVFHPEITVELIVVLGFTLGIATGTYAREIARALMAEALLLPVKKIILGNGPPIFSFNLKKTKIEIRLLPLGGGVRIQPTILKGKTRPFLFHSIPVLTNIILAAFFAGYSPDRSDWPHFQSLISGLALGQMWLIVFNLWPSFFELEEIRFPSDGRALAAILRKNRKEEESNLLKFFNGMLEPYSSNNGPVSLSSTSFEMLNLEKRWDHKDRLERVREAESILERGMRSGKLTVPEELWLLDAIITDLLFGESKRKLAELDEFSARALAIAPDIAAIRQTRGGVLVELGMHMEARDTIRSAMPPENASAYETALNLIFLSRAEHGTQNFEIAKELAHKARCLCETELKDIDFTWLLERMDAELVSTTFTVTINSTNNSP